jgi:signal transduction histidine kinase
MQPDRFEWPNRLRWWDIAWVLFSLANLYAMLLWPDWETVPFHFIWVSLTILYGFRVWKARPTTVILAFVMVLTGILIWIDVSKEETERVSMANLRLLERERRFVQDASHELRTPITVALGHAELIQRIAKDPTLTEDAAVIADELMRLRRLANRLLLLAGAEDPEFLHLEPVDVETIVVDAVRRWTATPRRWLLGSTEEATVTADADRLEVALDALIENAVNHTRESDTIEVAIRRRGAWALISVRDTGAGIPASDLDHIFDRFARADPGRSRHTGGFGLGLSIVKAIVDAHGGEVHVASAVGVGTTFEILLPLSPVGADRPEDTWRQGTPRLAPASTPAGRALDAYARDHDV